MEIPSVTTNFSANAASTVSRSHSQAREDDLPTTPVQDTVTVGLTRGEEKQISEEPKPRLISSLRISSNGRLKPISVDISHSAQLN